MTQIRFAVIIMTMATIVVKIIITVAAVALAMALKILDIITSGRRINSVGAKANNKSKRMPRIDINDPVSVQEGIAHYKDLDD